MTIYLAEKTAEAIRLQMETDQGASYRQHLRSILPQMEDAYRGPSKNPFRTHLGASGIGKECERSIWYSFRWFSSTAVEARMLRLFNRGHLEEARFIALLMSIGATVYQQDENGKQFRISDAGGHFGGSTDGVAINIPDLPPGTPCLLEFKTHNEKSFLKLKKQGVRDSKYEHVAQMSVYMRKLNLNVGLYCAVNKNTDELYFELIGLDTLLADQLIERGRKIVFLRDAPKKINESAGWFECNWCSHKAVCHLKKEPERNCRTCHHSFPQMDGTWSCREHEMRLTEEKQISGCSQYLRL